MKNKNIKSIFVCMLVYATLMTAAGTSMAEPLMQLSSDPEIEWMHIFDSIIDDRASYIDETTDGGYIVTGSTVIPPNGYTQLLLVKTDKNGEESWRNHFPTSGSNLYGTVVHQTTDNGYIIVGSVGYTYLWDVHVIKADANGGLVWQKSFGKGDQTDHGRDIIQTSDGGYIVLGSTSSYGQGQIDLWLIKLAADGTEQWNRTVGAATYDNPNKFTKTNDGGYIIVGSSDVVEGAGDIWVVKTNDAGEVSWEKTFGNADITEDAVDVITESNGYTILGTSNDVNFTESIWLLHLDAQGTLTSDQHISGNGTLHGTSITPTIDNGYFITGSLYDIYTYISDAYLLKLDHQGATQWVKTIDISEGLSDEANWGLQALDGGYVAIGNTEDPVNRTSDNFILKIEAETNVVLESVTGPFGVQAHVKNLGATEATGINVLMKISGGIFHRINISYMETINIPAGEEATISCKPFLGLGPINIAVTVNEVTSEFEGTQLIILTLIQS